MGKTVFIIHTSSVSVADLAGLFAEMAPGVIVRNIIDDSLLPEVLANGGVTAGVTSRLCEYAVQAEAAGATLIFNQCSSVGEVADIAARMVRDSPGEGGRAHGGDRLQDGFTYRRRRHSAHHHGTYGPAHQADG